MIATAGALYAGVRAFLFIFPGGGDNFATFGLFWMSAQEHVDRHGYYHLAV